MCSDIDVRTKGKVPVKIALRRLPYPRRDRLQDGSMDMARSGKALRKRYASRKRVATHLLLVVALPDP